MVRREKINAVGDISEDPDLISAEDFDLWLKIARVSEKFKLIPQTLGYYWVGGGNISSKHQSLKVFAALERHYATEISELGFSQGIYWMNYHKGMCCYYQGEYESAKKYLGLLSGSNAPLSNKIKSGLKVWWMKFI